jgi:hypothetical protein
LRDGLIRSDDKVQNRRTKLTTVGA